MPDYRTVGAEITQIVNDRLKRLKKTWIAWGTTRSLDQLQGEERFTLSVSHISPNWKQYVQIIEFKEVIDTKALTTSKEVTDALQSNYLDPSKCFAWQSDNCNSMVTAFGAFKVATKVDEDDCSDTLDTTKFTGNNFVAVELIA